MGVTKFREKIEKHNRLTYAIDEEIDETNLKVAEDGEEYKYE